MLMTTHQILSSHARKSRDAFSLWCKTRIEEIYGDYTDIYGKWYARDNLRRENGSGKSRQIECRIAHENTHTKKRRKPQIYEQYTRKLTTDVPSTNGIDDRPKKFIVILVRFDVAVNYNNTRRATNILDAFLPRKELL